MNLKALGNDFDAYINQITEPTEDVLKWWRDRTKGFPKLVPMVRDILAMQASSVASEGVINAARFQLGEHRHSLAADNLKISELFQDWINAERRNLGREPLWTKFQDDVDEVMQDYSDLITENPRLDIYLLFHGELYHGSPSCTSVLHYYNYN
uniref:HAT C-terminal dimerisation domain-containing protein n=1 Tax=Solanum lycopersicum TaxID=4081 RepID=A0A3Q7JAW2_SOLLC